MINAVSETVFEKATYKKPILTQRCLIPSSGFYEWDQKGPNKQPYLFFLRNTELFSLAGFFVLRTDSQGHEFKSFTILTTEPNKILEPFHNRMPVIIAKDEEESWLDPDMIECERIQRYFNPFPAELMDFYKVDHAVGKVGNNYPELIEKRK
jgi:putative SOS response-associated peptidase YedK